MSVGDIIRLAAVGRMHSHVIVNTFMYLHQSGDASPILAQELLKNAFAIDVLGPINLIQSSEVSYGTIETQLIFPLPVLARIDWDVSAVGAVVEAPVPDTVAFCIKRYGTLAGRRNRGRIFVPGLASDTFYNALNGRFVTGPGAMDNAVAALHQSLSPLGGSDVFQPILYHKGLGTYTFMNNSSGDSIPRSQRRRELDKGI